MPKWLDKVKSGTEKPTRDASKKQENRLAKEFGGRVTSNSGATFSENDVITPYYEIEAKTTKSSQYIFKMSEVQKMERKSDKNKVPIFIVNFEEFDREFVIMSKDDFLHLASNK